MRVALDISVLGRGVFDARNRTGIHRVVHEIALGLTQHPGIEFVPCCSSPSVLEVSAKAWECFGASGNAPFASSGNGRRLGRLARHLAEFSRRFEGSHRLHALMRKGISVLERSAWRFAPPVPRSCLSGIDVYLSPFDPLPPRRWMPKAKRAIFIHDLIPFLFPHLSREGGYLRRICASVDRDDTIITNSSASKNDLVLRGFAEDNIFVAPLFADPATFHAEPKNDDQAADPTGRGKPYLLVLGNLEARKNLGIALNAFDQACSSGPLSEVHMVLVGSRSPGHSEKLPARTQDRIHFTGRLPDTELGALYRGAKAFLFPSLYEGFGIPVLEAMQCGTPVIASNRSSIPEVAGNAAILVDPDSIDAMADALRRLLGDPGMQREMSRSGILQAKTFTRERFNREIARALDLP